MLGITPKDIYTKAFKYPETLRPENMLEITESLFDYTMTFDEIVAHDWTSQVGGWIEFYGLVRGEDY